jgi:predicted transglutaminase-like cysteine proteinase
METFARAITWRAAVFACLLVGLATITDVQARTLPNPRPAILIRNSAEPFGLLASALSDGALRQKWLQLKQRFDDDMVQLALCDGDRDGCASPPHSGFCRLSAVPAARRPRAGSADHHAINLAITQPATLHNGPEDVWSAPITTFASGSGDCEDAIAKVAALRLEGVPASLRIVIMRDSLRGEAMRWPPPGRGLWLMPDNRHMAIVEDDGIRNYEPRFVMRRTALMRYAAAPLFATGATAPPS